MREEYVRTFWECVGKVYANKNIQTQKTRNSLEKESKTTFLFSSNKMAEDIMIYIIEFACQNGSKQGAMKKPISKKQVWPRINLEEY